VPRNQYSASIYGVYNGAEPATYRDIFLQDMKSVTDSYCGTAVQLLSQTFGGPASQYRTWAPGATITSGPGTVTYSYGTPVRRSYTFNYTVGPGGTSLDSIDYFDFKQIGSRTRTTNWTMTLSADNNPIAAANYTFVAPAGSIPLVGLKPVTGG
jgi:hypothetical protein